MRKILAIFSLIISLAISACSTGLKRPGQLSSQEVERYMQQGVVAGIFVGHKVNSVQLESGEVFTATLPEVEIIATYVEHREANGKPVDYEME